MGLLKTNGAAKYRTVALIRFGRGAGQQTMKQQNYWLKVNESCVTENRFCKLWACWVLGMHQSEVTIPFPCSAAIIRINNTQNGATNTRPLSTNASPLSKIHAHSIIAGAYRNRIWTGWKKKTCRLVGLWYYFTGKRYWSILHFLLISKFKEYLHKIYLYCTKYKKVSKSLLHKQRKGGAVVAHIGLWELYTVTWWDGWMGLLRLQEYLRCQ